MINFKTCKRSFNTYQSKNAQPYQAIRKKDTCDLPSLLFYQYINFESIKQI